MTQLMLADKKLMYFAKVDLPLVNFWSTVENKHIQVLKNTKGSPLQIVPTLRKIRRKDILGKFLRYLYGFTQVFTPARREASTLSNSQLVIYFYRRFFQMPHSKKSFPDLFSPFQLKFYESLQYVEHKWGRFLRFIFLMASWCNQNPEILIPVQVLPFRAILNAFCRLI